MDTLEYIQKMAAYKLAVARGEMEVGKTRIVGKKADEPKSIQKKEDSILKRFGNTFLPDIAGSALGMAVHGAEEYGNFKYDQSTPIGELFSDFANDQLKKKGLEGNVYYTQTFPRSSLPANESDSEISKILKSLISAKTPSTSAFGFDKITDPEDIRENFSRPFAEDLKRHLMHGEPMDMLTKARRKGDSWFMDFMRDYNTAERDFLKNNKQGTPPFLVALDKLKENVEPFKDARAIVKTPRNNMRALAHEYGHIESEMGVNEIQKTKLGPVYDFFRTVLSDPSDGLFQNYAPSGIKKFVNNISDKLNSTPLGANMNSFVQKAILGADRTLPSNIVLGTKLINVISPETSKKLEENDPTGILKYIDEHPVASAVIAGIPQAIRESATTIPGTKMTYEFWKALKDEGNQFMGNHVFADEVRKGVKNLADINPTWEAAKFFGKNLGKTTLGITAPIIGLMAMNKVKEWLKDKDEQ